MDIAGPKKINNDSKITGFLPDKDRDSIPTRTKKGCKISDGLWCKHYMSFEISCPFRFEDRQTDRQTDGQTDKVISISDSLHRHLKICQVNGRKKSAKLRQSCDSFCMHNLQLTTFACFFCN